MLQCVAVPIPPQVSLRHGWLVKMTRQNRWHKRYFLVFKHTLVWYKSDEPDQLAQGGLTLAESTIVRGAGGDVLEITSPLAILLKSGSKETLFGRTFKIKCKDAEELDGWHNLLVQQNSRTTAVTKWPETQGEWII